LSLPYCDAALQQKGADLIDDASALADQSLTHTMQRLQVELVGGLRRHKLHRWTLHRLGNRLRVAEIILLPLGICRTYFAGISLASWPKALSFRLR
jgi:hypothetical protein